MILEKKKEKNRYVYYVNGKKVKWIVITNMNNEAASKDSFLTSSSGPIILKYQMEGLSGIYERQFSAASLMNEDKAKISWNLLDELPSADWAWDKLIARGVLV